MKNVTITEGGSGYQPGSLEHQLRSHGFIPVQVSPPGLPPVSYRVQATDEQISFLRNRYFSHRIEVEEAPPAEDPRDATIRSLRAEHAGYVERIQALEGELAQRNKTIEELSAKKK